MAEMKSATTPMAGVIGTSSVIGTDVADKQGRRLGKIHDILLRTTSGEIELVILNFGGHFVGIEQRYYPLPWRLLKFDEASRGYVVDLDRQKLDAAPTCELSETGVWVSDNSIIGVKDYYSSTAV